MSDFFGGPTTLTARIEAVDRRGADFEFLDRRQWEWFTTPEQDDLLWSRSWAPGIVRGRWFEPTSPYVTGGAPVINIFDYGVTAGGLQTAGAASMLAKSLPPVTGGLSVSGTSTMLRKSSTIGVGGIAIAGVAPRSVRAAFVGVGGGTTGGIAPRLYKLAFKPSGGLVTSGAASKLARMFPHVAGGLTTSGAAVTSPGHTFAFTPSGGLSTSGIGRGLYVAKVVGLGGVLLSGFARNSRASVLVSSGGALLAGAADYEFSQSQSHLPTAFTGVVSVYPRDVGKVVI